MPFGDGTGPSGKGPGTGRGMGRCGMGRSGGRGMGKKYFGDMNFNNKNIFSATEAEKDVTDKREHKKLKEKLNNIEDQKKLIKEKNESIGPNIYNTIKVDVERCEGCGTCINVCPADAISIVHEKAFINDYCIECGSCVEECPNGAMILT